MKDSFYIDTNIFIYLSDESSPFYKACSKFWMTARNNNSALTTSAETIQELIHVAHKKKQVTRGLQSAQKVLNLVDNLLPINKGTIELFLECAKKYKTVSSRDLIHLAVCMENKIGTIVTYDRDFRKFKEMKAFTPEEIS